MHIEIPPHTFFFRNEQDMAVFKAKHDKLDCRKVEKQYPFKNHYWSKSMAEYHVANGWYLDGDQTAIDYRPVPIDHRNPFDYWGLVRECDHDTAERNLAFLEITDINRYDDHCLMSRTNFLRLMDYLCDNLQNNPSGFRTTDNKGRLLSVKRSLVRFGRFVHGVFVIDGAGRDTPVGTRQTHSWQYGFSIFSALAEACGIEQEWADTTWFTFDAPVNKGGNQGKPKLGSAKSQWMEVLGMEWIDHIEKFDGAAAAGGTLDDDL